VARALIHRFATLELAAGALAERLVVDAARAIAARGAFRCALPGGTTPVVLYRLLASEPWRARIDWTRAELFFTDERAVPPEAEGSNFALVARELAMPLGIASERVRRMEADALDLDASSAAYERELNDPLDVVLLGMGTDGHVASLFPGSALLDDGERRCAWIADSPKPPPTRMTLMPRALRESGALLVLCGGRGKAGAVTRALTPGIAPRECPAALAAGGDWYLDDAAAAPDTREPGAGDDPARLGVRETRG
jgi:6-phosphogluconolactonase